MARLTLTQGAKFSLNRNAVPVMNITVGSFCHSKKEIGLTVCTVKHIQLPHYVPGLGTLRTAFFLLFSSILEGSLICVIFLILGHQLRRLILFTKSFEWPVNFICFLCKNLQVLFITTQLYVISPSQFYK